MTARSPKPRAGSRWRLLVHDLPVPPSRMYGVSHNVVSDRSMVGGGDSEWSKTQEIPNTEFDELVVGGKSGVWLHIEQMDTGSWWMSIGGVAVLVKADRDGNPKRVSVYGPHDYDAPVDGCVYECTWSDEGSRR